ncbi:hypothetical protein E3N88_07573 [Mikania micrantha]|uniref:ARID domain-containing protein n=1 Tax=Mikania micrantha TaxID=192012 RepID=A0A5N6PU13_9ASTR|nr:hypothetical protein E3N88_07573 [Mikania micrantha]
MKYNPKEDSGKNHCENSGIRARSGKNQHPTHVRNPNLTIHSESQKIENVLSNSDINHVRRDDSGWKGKQKMHQGMQYSVIRRLEQGFQKVDMVETSKGKARCLEQEYVPVRTKFEYVKHDDLNTRLDHDEFLEKFYETLDDQTIFELERKSLRRISEDIMTRNVWFYEEYFQQNTKEYPPTLPNGEPIDLFDLYMTVEGLGERRIVAKERKWSEVGEQLGLAENGPNLRIIYDGYLELLDWMYSMEKEPKIEDGEILDNELYLQEMLDANFDDDFELELLEYTERNKEDVAAVNEDAIQGLGGNVGP